MIGNYILIPDLFAFLLALIVLINININDKSYSLKTYFIKRIWYLIAILSVYSVVLNSLRVVDKIDAEVYNFFYVGFLTLCSFAVLEIVKFLITASNLSKRQFDIVKFMLYAGFFIVFIINIGFKINKIVPSTNMILDYSLYITLKVPATQIFLVFSVAIAVICFYVKKDSIISSIYTNIIWFAPIGSALIIMDYIIGKLSNPGLFFTILPISIAAIAINIFIVFYSQPYDEHFGTLGQDTFDSLLQASIEKNEKYYIIRLIIENSGEIETAFSSEVLSGLMKKIVYYFDKLCDDKNIFKIREDVVFQIEKDRYDFNKEVLPWIQGLKELLDNCGSLNVVYKILCIEIDSNIKTIQEFYEIQNHAGKKCQFNDYYICEKKDLNHIKRKIIIEKELMDIVKQNNLNDERIVLNLQPIYNIKNDCFETAEALIRLNSDNTGYVFPDEFINVAESLDIIHFITKIVLNKACKCVKKMRAEGFDIDAITVNISPKDIQKEDFVDCIIQLIKSNEISFTDIRLEFLESLAISDYDKVRDKMNQLKDYGVQFYLDDFGSGYSNLDRIITLPFSTIKFDKSIVWGAVNNDKKYNLLKEVTKVFQSFNINVLYEGIENDDYENIAREIGVHSLQGYKYAKPLIYDDAKHYFA